jgi:hypothetical protein
MKALKGVTAARPGVLDVALDFEVFHWGTIATFEATREQLLGAGVAFKEMFEDLGKTGCKTAEGGYGNKYKVQLLQGRRHPEGTFRLELITASESLYGDPASPDNRNLKWWQSVGESVEAEVEQILRQMRAPRKEVRS